MKNPRRADQIDAVVEVAQPDAPFLEPFVNQLGGELIRA